MTANGWLQIFFLLLVVLLITKPLGGFMARVFGRERTWLDPVMRPWNGFSTGLLVWTRVTTWIGRNNALALLLFSGVSMILLYVLQRVQQWAWLPWNPQKLAGVPPALAFNNCGFVYHKYELAELFARVHHELSNADGGLAYHNWVFGSRRNGAGNRLYSRHFAA